MIKSIDFEHLTPAQTCPHCGHPFDRAGGDEDRPEPGDLSVCIRCLGVMEFGPGLLLVKADLDLLSEQDLLELRRVQLAIYGSRKK